MLLFLEVYDDSGVIFIRGRFTNRLPPSHSRRPPLLLPLPLLLLGLALARRHLHQGCRRRRRPTQRPPTLQDGGLLTLAAAVAKAAGARPPSLRGRPRGAPLPT